MNEIIIDQKQPPTFCLSSIFMAKYCSELLCLTSITLPKEPVPRVFILSKSSRHVVLCEEHTTEHENTQKRPMRSSDQPLTRLTCGGHSHLRKKSSLALARNSLTENGEKKKKKRQTQWVYTHCWLQINKIWGVLVKQAKRPNTIRGEGTVGKNSWEQKPTVWMGVNSHLDIFMQKKKKSLF